MSRPTMHLMDTASAEKMVNAFSKAVKPIPLMNGERNETEYHRALALIEFLIDRDDLDNPLFELLARQISDYENHSPEFVEFNRRLESTPPGVATLRTLMDQYGLKAADLAKELGSKSNVSNILNGRRALTVKHVKALSERFNLPAQAFIE